MVSEKSNFLRLYSFSALLMKVRFAGCLRLIYIAVAGLRAPLSRFLEGAPHKFSNELSQCTSLKICALLRLNQQKEYFSSEFLLTLYFCRCRVFHILCVRHSGFSGE